MGKTESKLEAKTVDSTGAVNNNFVVEGLVPIIGEEMTILLYIIVIVKIIEF